MKLRFRIILIWISIFVLSIATIYGQPYKAIIKGRVVDEFGKPLNRVVVSLYSQTENEDDILSDDQTVYTDENGDFSIENVSNKEVRNRNLYIMGPVPNSAIPIFYLPPSRSFLKLKPKLFARSLVLSTGSLDQGELKTLVATRPVEIAMSDIKGQPLFRSTDQWQEIFYVLRDGYNNIFAESGISRSESEKAINVANGIVRFALPDGEWQIDFVSDLSEPGLIIARTPKFTVRAGGTTKIKVVSRDRLAVNQQSRGRTCMKSVYAQNNAHFWRNAKRINLPFAKTNSKNRK